MMFVRRSAVATAIVTYVLLVLGGIVPITAAGIGCRSWPLCQGRLIFASNLPPVIQYSGQAAALTATVLLAVTAVAVWRSKVRDRLVWVPAVGLFLLFALQILLGTATALAEWPMVILVAHPATALALLGTVLVLATAAFNPAPEVWPRLGARAQRQARRYRTLVTGTTLASFVLLMTGGAGARAGTLGGAIHQATTGAVGFLLVLTLWQTSRERRSQPALVRAAAISGLLFFVQVVVGTGFLVGLSTAQVAEWHRAMASLVWASLVVFKIGRAHV